MADGRVQEILAMLEERPYGTAELASLFECSMRVMHADCEVLEAAGHVHRREGRWCLGSMKPKRKVATVAPVSPSRLCQVCGERYAQERGLCRRCGKTATVPPEGLYNSAPARLEAMDRVLEALRMPDTVPGVANRLGLTIAVVSGLVGRLSRDGRVTRGGVLPSPVGGGTAAKLWRRTDAVLPPAVRPATKPRRIGWRHRSEAELAYHARVATTSSSKDRVRRSRRILEQSMREAPVACLGGCGRIVSTKDQRCIPCRRAHDLAQALRAQHAAQPGEASPDASDYRTVIADGIEYEAVSVGARSLIGDVDGLHSSLSDVNL